MRGFMPLMSRGRRIIRGIVLYGSGGRWWGAKYSSILGI